MLCSPIAMSCPIERLNRPMRMAGCAIVVALLVILQFGLLNCTAQWSPPADLIPPIASAAVTAITNDGLLWHATKPIEPQRVGWEDEWMMEWKWWHHRPDQRPHCRHEPDTPYDDELLCKVPAYIPARLPPPLGEEKKPKIPRIIFVTLFKRRLGRAMFTSLTTLLLRNPEYEFVFFVDEDIARFVCEDVGSSTGDFAIPIFSKVRSGAMRGDVWHLLVIQKYGGVYLDSDVSALGPLR